MAESEGGKLSGIDLTKKVGPVPLWTWLLGVTAAGWFILKSHKAAPATAASGGAGGQQQGQFSTSTTTTDPTSGNQTTYTASGPNSSITSPAQLMWGAGPMGTTSPGDVYVNLPPGAAPVPGPTGPAGPPGPAGSPAPAPAPAPIPPRNPDWGKWETVTSGDTLFNLTARVLGDGHLWNQVWNDPVNRAEHDLRGDPSQIKPGDVIWVFNGWKPGWQAPADFVPYKAPSTSLPQTAVIPPTPDASQN